MTKKKGFAHELLNELRRMAWHAIRNQPLPKQPLDPHCLWVGFAGMALGAGISVLTLLGVFGWAPVLGVLSLFTCAGFGAICLGAARVMPSLFSAAKGEK